MRSKGRLGTAQGVLRRAASKKSVGESHQGFMSEVKDELKVCFGMVNLHLFAVYVGRISRGHTGGSSAQDLFLLSSAFLLRCSKARLVNVLLLV